MKANYRNLLLQGNEWIDGSDEYGLILTDGSFQGYYTEEKYVWIHKHWLVDVLDLPEFYECEKRHTKDEFKEIQKKYNIHKGYGKITLKNGYLSTDIDLEMVNDVLGWETDIVVELPTDGFKKKAIYRDCMRSVDDTTRSISKFSDDVFSYALTNKYTVNYSERIRMESFRWKFKESTNQRDRICFQVLPPRKQENT